LHALPRMSIFAFYTKEKTPMMGRIESNGIGRWLRHSTATLVAAASLLALAAPGCRYAEEKMDRSCCAPQKDTQKNNCSTPKEGPSVTEPATESHHRAPQESHAAKTRTEAETAPAPPGTDWSGGTLTGSIDAPLARTYGAARLTLAQMGMTIEEQELTDTTGRLAGEMGGEERLMIGLRESGQAETRVRIRAGYVGDKDQSERALEMIRTHLDRVSVVSDTKWAGGTLEADLHATLRRVHQAARMAKAKMDLAIENQNLQPPTSTLAASLGDGEELQVGLRQTEAATTHIRIRAGYVGNEQMSRQLLRHIRENL
jgi:hypothetical protein